MPTFQIVLSTKELTLLLLQLKLQLFSTLSKIFVIKKQKFLKKDDEDYLKNWNWLEKD